MVRRAVLLLLLQQQQDELDNEGPSMRSPYNNEGRRRHDQWVPRPALRPPPPPPPHDYLHGLNC